jgi:thiosulfate/3-mercaptopyruvate sulfurtransferase
MPRPLLTAQEAAALVGEATFLDARAEPHANQAFAVAHVCGALRADLEADLSARRDPIEGGRHPLPAMQEWRARLGSWGIGPSTPVVIYDASGGGMAAARAWWMLRAIGHERVSVVDGGWQALQAAGVCIERGEARAPAAILEPYPSSVRDWPVVDATFVERVRNEPTWRVIDARAPERYSGDIEPLDPVAGHIPGARNLYWQSQLREDGRIDSCERLEARFREALEGVSPSRVVCYCGSGVTACHLLWAMEACGLPGARLYVGSWSEWCRQGRPCARR